MLTIIYSKFIFTENIGKFSECSLTEIKSKIANLGNDDCFLDTAFDENFTDLEVALCGNHIVEPGEECDCGMNQTICDDPCCYPAIISIDERSANNSAKSCQRTERQWCHTRPGIVFGFYLPWAVIVCAIIFICVILYRDWHRQKRFFKHITENRVRIID